MIGGIDLISRRAVATTVGLFGALALASAVLTYQRPLTGFLCLSAGTLSILLQRLFLVIVTTSEQRVRRTGAVDFIASSPRSPLVWGIAAGFLGEVAAQGLCCGGPTVMLGRILRALIVGGFYGVFLGSTLLLAMAVAGLVVTHLWVNGGPQGGATGPRRSD